MRNWINGPHFPDELKIQISENPTEDLDTQIVKSLNHSFSSCEWTENGIISAIKSVISDDSINARDCYRTLYMAILGKEKGPKIAPIISELDREKVLYLLT